VTPGEHLAEAEDWILVAEKQIERQMYDKAAASAALATAHAAVAMAQLQDGAR
jgi:hypothetical protein